MSKLEYEELIAFHPGYYIREIIEDMEMTQSEFAKRLNTTDKTLSKLINGEIPLSDDIAQKLSQMLGTSVKVWLDLQSSYKEKVIEIRKRKSLDLEKEYLKQIDYAYFTRLNVVKSTENHEQRVAELRKFLKISSLSILGEKDFLVAYKTVIANVKEKNIINSNAWVQTALNMADKIECKPFNRKLLETYLTEIRKMTLQKADVFYPRICNIFNECGIAFVLLPHLKNSGVNGAVKWINKEKVLFAINNRRLYADVFWFSLFHEIKHILQQRIKDIFISGNKEDYKDMDSKLEIEADCFARDYLIPQEQYSMFIKDKNFTENSIINFANDIGIHTGLVVGRLQHDEYLEHYQFSHLKEKI